MKRLNLICVILGLYAGVVTAQNGNFKPSYWRLTQLSGNVSLSGTYNEGNNILSGINDETQNSSLSGAISLFTKSYIYHPNLLSLDISGSYEPKIMNYQAIVRPDFSTTNSQRFIRMNTQIMKRTNYSVQTFYNYNESYSNRENFASIKSVSRYYGGVFNFRNTSIPLTLNYSNSKQDQLEVESNRQLVREEERLETVSNKDYGKKNHASLTLNRTLYKNKISNANNVPTFVSEVYNFTLNNTLNLAKEKEVLLRSRLNYYSFNTRLNDQERMSFNNTFNAELTNRLTLSSQYNFNLQHLGEDTETNYQINNALTHRLYESLVSNISINYNAQKHALFSQSLRLLSANFSYTKKIPFKGKLRLNYAYRNTLVDREGEIAIIPVYNESYYISDSQIILLENSDVDIETLVIKDATGSIIYQEGIDYYLIVLGDFIEIQRVPGGLITNNSSILLDYSFIQPESYKLANSAINYGASIEFLTSKIQVFYNYSSKKYHDPRQMPYLKLDFYKRQKYGTKLKAGFINGGVEYDDFKSNIVPFKLLNYYVNMKGVLLKKLNYSLTYNRINYLMIAEEGRTQQFEYLTGNLAYAFNYKTNLNMDVAYRSQEVDALDIGWLTGRLSFRTRFNQLEVKTELNYYNKTFDGQDSNFMGASIQLIRKF